MLFGLLGCHTELIQTKTFADAFVTNLAEPITTKTANPCFRYSSTLPHLLPISIKVTEILTGGREFNFVPGAHYARIVWAKANGGAGAAGARGSGTNTLIGPPGAPPTIVP